MNAALDALMRHAIDYAGLFPPAGLSVGEAIAEYARVRAGAMGWIAGALVVSSDRLREIRTDAIPLSVVMRRPSPASVDDVMRATPATIVALEFPPLSAADIRTTAAAVPPGTRAFFEVAPNDHLEASLDAVSDAGAFAKIRTGGVTAEAFPDASAVHRFFRGCVDRKLLCKATAGLHHAVVGRYRLTYEADSAVSTMFGFLNVSAAAALVHAGAPESDVLQLLKEPAPSAFVFEGDMLTWREYRVSVSDIQAMRRNLFWAFGSCSLQEPIDDLVRMQLT